MIHTIHTQKEPDLAFAGLALLILFGILIWHDNPIESARPPDPSAIQPQYTPVIGHATYESWLWQDPFGQNHHAEESSKNEKVNSADDRKSRCYPQVDKGIVSIIKEDKPVKLLASIVKVRPNTIENKELRIRHRYAMVAGLIESGYKASEPHRLHFCSIQNQGDDNKKYDFRWERFTDKNKERPDVILIWVDSDAVTSSESLRMFVPDYLFQENKISANRVNLFVFDWANSIKNKEEIENNYQNIKIKKPIGETDGATEKIDQPIKKPIGETDGVAKKLINQLVRELKERNIKKSSEIAIITEHDLNDTDTRDLPEKFWGSFFDKIERECKNQTVQEALDKSRGDANARCKKQNFFYLKGLDAIQQIIDKKNKNEDYQKGKKLNDPFSIVDLHNPPIGPTQFDYVYRLARQIKKNRDGVDLEERIKGVKAVIIFGSDFYDKLVILQALRTEMPHIPVFTTDLDARMFHPQHWRWTRNLVVASHFDLRLAETYQKHIPAFRDSQQTDIYYNTIKILKSNEPKKSSENTEIPPLPEHAAISPLIFEIGRNGPVRMEQEHLPTDEIKNIHPGDNSLEQAKNRYWLLLGITVVLIFLLMAVRHHSFAVFSWLLLTSIAVFGFAWLAIAEFGESLSFTEGISLWPTIFIRIIAISLAIFYIVNAVRILESNFYRLNKKHFGEDLKTLWDDREPMSLKEGPKKIASFIKNIFCKNWNNKGYPFFSILFISVLSGLFYAINDLNPAGFPIELCLLLLIVLYIWMACLGKKKKYDLKPTVKWIEKDNCYQQETNQVDEKNQAQDLCRKFIKLETCNDKKGLWQEYYEHGRLKYRSARVLGMWLYFAIMETMLFYLLPSWPQPCRGESACVLDWSVGIISFIVIMLLTFFVLDAVRLNFYWIRKLRKKHLLLVDKSLLSPDDKKDGEFERIRSPGRKPLEALDKMIDLVAERTYEVDKLIYYPLICIMLMLFAGTTYFDNQDFPLSKGITFAASISLLIFSGFMIRYEARMLKLAVVKSAENLAKDYNFNKTEVDAVIEKINNHDNGVFQPMLEQPVMRALLLIVASLGLFAGEYIKMFG
ncbi:hypothetical protein [Nitrosomonas sp. Nm58]|uniref:hypothetical protein n=1 Tax=Nitrosomonas sp. Nm58 TaxID=200126 RepID=UPI0008942FE3|nr:hypothetical protein [Nitrosomonas sp. Nm58]SDY74698.1 hypothetical protein SAMN05421754_102012 [Nitrosomonas sp. Nm58]